MKWTMRKNGHIEATVRLRLHIPKDMALWLKEHADMTQAQAVDWIINHVTELADDWRQLAVEDGDYVCTVSVDDYDSETLKVHHSDAYVVYGGPPVALGR